MSRHPSCLFFAIELIHASKFTLDVFAPGSGRHSTPFQHRRPTLNNDHDDGDDDSGGAAGTSISHLPPTLTSAIHTPIPV